MTKKKDEPMSMQGKIITGVIIVIVLFFMFSIFSAPTKTNKNSETKTNVNMISLIDDDAVLGNPNAKVTIVEFSDYECPYCKAFDLGTYKKLKQKYIDTGLVKFVYRDFPFTFHKYAQKSAEAAECAGEQDKYYEMHDKLFILGVEGGINEYKKYAEDLGLNSSEFNECLDSGKMAVETNKDMLDGQLAGVTGTPAFFINGVNIVGNQPISEFEKIIDNELKK